MQLIDTGDDYTSLYGSRLAQNDKFLFISGNGYHIFNGLVKVYYNNFTTNDDGNIEKYIHSTINSPYLLNSNFGLTLCATNDFLFIGGLSYDVYAGIIYIFQYKYNKWLFIQTLQPHLSKNLMGFGNHIFINKNNTLYIGTFYGETYIYEYNVKFTFKNIIQSVNTLDVNSIILSDQYDNIILWHSSLLKVWNFKSQIWVELDYVTKCLKMEISGNRLYASCNNQISIYDIIYDVNKNIKEYKIYQTIYNEDLYFSMNFYVSEYILLVTGNNNLYKYTKINDLWNLKDSLNIPNKNVNDYTIQMINDYLILGNYEFDDLRGGIWSYKLLNDDNNNNNNNDNIDINNLNTITNNNFLNKIGLSISLFLFGCLITIFLILLCYFCVYLLTPKIDDKKKKDKEEDESPYKVYSYVGYVETDDAPSIIYPPNQTPYYFYYPTTPTILNSYVNTGNIDMNKTNFNGDKPNSDKVEYVSSNEKVVSYKGYTYDYIKQEYQKTIYPILKDLRKKE